MRNNLLFVFMVAFIGILLVSSFSLSDSFTLLQNGNEPSSTQILEEDATSFYDNIRTAFQKVENSDFLPIDYINSLITEIAKDSSIYDIIGFSIGMVVYGVFVYNFYRFLSKRDLFNINIEKISKGHFSSSGKKSSGAPRAAAFIATNFFVFPFVIFLWFLGYSSFMFILVQHMPTATIFLVSSSLIIAIRISAYYREDLSRDLAKLLPFALLAIFLFDPQFYSLVDVLQRLSEMPSFLTQIASFMIVAMIVEIFLSIIYLIKIRFFHKEKKSKVDDSEHPI
ncbi:hypothetical protein [Nitrosarchaeum sp. AC2]|uniref:hypothetical protein n=1 Tax=Nitrosarchaeum sp. AC2 TaxID=2259673 RepID=UPI0015CEDDA4|nr:hypothetical protein [Nitrosarchaeum sp. AC2]QLH11306.1 hypothetical protein DSQ20_07400 [Nitrosarchaeum sp. AC2]